MYEDLFLKEESDDPRLLLQDGRGGGRVAVPWRTVL
jgi:hypothetical protein